MKENTIEGPKYGAFEFQNWPVYERTLDFVAQAYRLCSILPKDSATGLRDQLRRASHSIALNIAEGCSRFSQKEKANYFRISKGSVFECVAVLDLIRKVGLIEEDFGPVYKNLETIGRMLSGLIKFVEKRERGLGLRVNP